MSARDDVLTRVRSALGPSPRPDAPAPETRGETILDDPVGLFAERVADYRAVVVRCGPDEVAQAVADGLGEVSSVVVPQGFPSEWLAQVGDSVDRRADDELSSADLDATGAVVTTATVGIAVTGTIILDHGPGQGRRALSLVPDRHVCIVTADQVVPDVPDAVRALAGSATRPQTWISGPSATSDIELDRVEGVHGPRTLYVVIVG